MYQTPRLLEKASVRGKPLPDKFTKGTSDMPKILSTIEVAEILGCSRVSVADLIKRKILRASRVGVRRWGVTEEDLKAFLAARANTPFQEPTGEVKP